METNEEFLRPRIRVVLSSMGFNERYQAFDYLVEIIFDMCLNKNEKPAEYHQCVNNLSKKYNIEPISVTGQIGILLNANQKFCEALGICNKRNFYRIKAITSFVLNEIDKRFVN